MVAGARSRQYRPHSTSPQRRALAVPLATLRAVGVELTTKRFEPITGAVRANAAAPGVSYVLFSTHASGLVQVGWSPMSEPATNAPMLLAARLDEQRAEVAALRLVLDIQTTRMNDRDGRCDLPYAEQQWQRALHKLFH